MLEGRKAAAAALFGLEVAAKAKRSLVAPQASVASTVGVEVALLL